ncbi:hypothetical protein AHiyo8_28410 [Arthrobacter sp. Hiyo8]|nr:hypothetical protein AHiyo8_28410 [Arthrobacter sp. Hiyo8]
MQVLEAIRTAESPALIPEQYVTWEGEGDAARPVVDGIEDALERATAAHATFSELGLPWARPAVDAGRPVLSLPDGGELGGAALLATVQSGTGLATRLSPRPYLHPVRTLAGVPVTDHLPADHPWHLGAGFTLQDVNGTNFWGGKTYIRASGPYEERQDHGRIIERSTVSGPGLLEQELSWQASDGAELLRERRTTGSRQLDRRTWQLELRTELTAVVDSSLGSPGSNGAPEAATAAFSGACLRAPKLRSSLPKVAANPKSTARRHRGWLGQPTSLEAPPPWCSLPRLRRRILGSSGWRITPQWVRPSRGTGQWCLPQATPWSARSRCGSSTPSCLRPRLPS